MPDSPAFKKKHFTKVKRDTFIASDAMGYTPHVNTAGGVKGCTLHVPKCWW
jgi:hypothetical protein